VISISERVGDVVAIDEVDPDPFKTNRERSDRGSIAIRNERPSVE